MIAGGGLPVPGVPQRLDYGLLGHESLTPNNEGVEVSVGVVTGRGLAI